MRRISCRPPEYGEGLHPRSCDCPETCCGFSPASSARPARIPDTSFAPPQAATLRLRRCSPPLRASPYAPPLPSALARLGLPLDPRAASSTPCRHAVAKSMRRLHAATLRLPRTRPPCGCVGAPHPPSPRPLTACPSPFRLPRPQTTRTRRCSPPPVAAVARPPAPRNHPPRPRCLLFPKPQHLPAHVVRVPQVPVPVVPRAHELSEHRPAPQPLSPAPAPWPRQMQLRVI